MELISTGINEVRAFALPGGIAGDGSFTPEPMVVLVRWQSEWNDKLHQVYVNGEYAGYTFNTEQREMKVHLCLSSRAARVEVFAIEPIDGVKDFSDELGAIEQMGQVVLSWPRWQNLPIGGGVEVYSNNGSGEIDYDDSVTTQPNRIWLSWQDKAGFGMSQFGRSDWGYDGSAATGFGKGSFGKGEFGFCGDMICWNSESLQKGAYKFAAKIVDSFGNEDEGESETEFLTVIPAAVPCEEVNVVSFDKETNELVLNIS